MMTAFQTYSTLGIALIVISIILAIGLKAPKLVVYGFISVLFMFSYSTWGQMGVENNIYSRGVGMFYFSLLNLALFVGGIAVLLRKLANPHNPYLTAPLSPYFFSFVFLLLGHIALGVISGVDLNIILGYEGLINILNMFIFFYLIITAFNSEKDKRDLLLVILALAGIRTLFGMVRYFLFDGDSANPYRNFESMDIKIFFFDISDNFIAALAAFCAAWLLLTPSVRLNLFKRFLLYGFLAMQVAAIALSFRRSSLVGLALMFAMLVFLLPSVRRIKFIVLGLVMISATAMVIFQERLQFAGATDIFSSLTYDILPKPGDDNDRFYELRAAAQSLDGNWLFGLGTWGRFTGDMELLAYQFGQFNFVHSGFGHIVLKAGLVGLLLFIGLLATYISYYFRHRKSLYGNSRLLADAGFAGFLFWVPTLLIGTPIIEFRTMLLIGLTLALPFVAVGMVRYQNYNYKYHYAAA